MSKISLNSVKAWFKRNIFVAPLKPRTQLMFAFVAILLALVPIATIAITLSDYIYSLVAYRDDVEMPTSAIVGCTLLFLLSLTIIITSIVVIIKVLYHGYKKRKSNRKDQNKGSKR